MQAYFELAILPAAQASLSYCSLAGAAAVRSADGRLREAVRVLQDAGDAEVPELAPPRPGHVCRVLEGLEKNVSLQVCRASSEHPNVSKVSPTFL